MSNVIGAFWRGEVPKAIITSVVATFFLMIAVTFPAMAGAGDFFGLWPLAGRKADEAPAAPDPGTEPSGIQTVVGGRG